MTALKPSLTLSPIAITGTAKSKALWIADLGVFFVGNSPVAFVKGSEVYVKSALRVTEIRRIAQWLQENHLPSMTTATRVSNISTEVLIYLFSTLSQTDAVHQ